MATTLLTGLDLRSYASEITPSVAKESAFLRALQANGQNIKVMPKSETRSVFRGIDLSDETQVLNEGDTKDLTGSMAPDSIELILKKFVNSGTLSNEYAESTLGSALADLVASEAPKYFGSALDRIVSGVTVAPAGITGYSGAALANVATYKDLMDAIAQAAAGGTSPNAIVMSSKMYFSLKGLVATDGHPIFLGTDTIGDLPVFTFNSSVAVGIIFDTNDAFAATNEMGTQIRENPYGAGWGSNSTQVLVEGFYAYGALSPATRAVRITTNNEVTV